MSPFFWAALLTASVRGAAAAPPGAPAASAASPAGASVSTGAASAAGAVDPERQKLLVEFWERRVFGRGVDAWTEEDLDLLQRMRKAEVMGAIGLLENKMGGLHGYVTAHRAGGAKVLWLTKEGYQEYTFVKSQLARQYFENRGTDAKYVFKLHDLNGKRLFNGKGLLTPEGEKVYDQILLRRPVRWKGADGKAEGNTRPEKK